MKHFEKVSTFWVMPLLKQLAEHPELWDQHTIRRESVNSPHTKMSDIWVRYNDVRPYEESGDYSTFNDPHVPIWYPAAAALPTAKAIAMELMSEVGGEMLGGVLITKIPPGGGIDPHADFGWHVEYFDKFYVCLQNDPGARFWCEHDGVREYLEPKVGDVWLFDNRKQHWVENKSERDRITLIICIRTDLFGRA